MPIDTKALIHYDRRNGFRYKEGKHIPLWALLILPFLILSQPLFIWVQKSVDWKSAWKTVLIFEASLFFVERRSLRRGHWVYNESRIQGTRIFGVPIEEPLLLLFDLASHHHFDISRIPEADEASTRSQWRKPVNLLLWEIWSYVHVPLVWFLFKRFGDKNVSGSMIAGSIFGCFIEFSTAPLWEYHFRFTIYKSIAPSIILGWGVLFTLVVTFSEKLYCLTFHSRRIQVKDKRLFLFDVIAACLIAFPLETIGYKSNIWSYNSALLQWNWGTVPFLNMPLEALVAYALLMLIAPTFIRQWRDAFTISAGKA